MPGLEDKSDQLTQRGLKGQELVGENNFSQSALNNLMNISTDDYQFTPDLTQMYGDTKDYYEDGLVSKDITPTEALQFGGIDELAAQNQSTSRLVGHALGQILTETVLGTLEGVGYIPEMNQIMDEEKAAREGFGNAWTEFFKEAKENINQDLFPIHKTQAAQDFAPGDATWWASNAGTLGTALSLMLPSMGVAKLASYAGKYMQLAPKIASTAAKLGVVDNIASLMPKAQAIKYAKTLGRELTAAEKTTLLAEKFGNAAIPALYSRYTENFLEANGKFEESMNYYLSKGYSEDKARQRAGREAADTWKGNAMLLPLDFLQYSGIMKGLDGYTGLSKGITNSLGKKGSTALNFMSQMGSEAAEEGFQFIAGKEAEAKEREGVSYFDGNFMTRLSDYIDDPEMQTSMFWGAAGGALFQGAGPGLNKVGQSVVRAQLAYDAKKATAAYFKDTESFDKASNDQLLDVLTKRVNKTKAQGRDISEELYKFAAEVDMLKQSTSENSQESPESAKTTIDRLDKFSSRVKKFGDKFTELDKIEQFRGNDTLKLKYLSTQLQIDMIDESIASKTVKRSEVEAETKAPAEILGMIEFKSKIAVQKELIEEASKSKAPNAKAVEKNLKAGLKIMEAAYKAKVESYLEVNKDLTEKDISTSRDVELDQMNREIHKLVAQKESVLKPEYKYLQQLDKNAADKIATKQEADTKKANTKAAEEAGKNAVTQEDKDIAKHTASETNSEGAVEAGDRKETKRQTDNLKKSTVTTETKSPEEVVGGTSLADLLGEREYKDIMPDTYNSNPKAFKKLKNELEPLLRSISDDMLIQQHIDKLMSATNANEFNMAYNDVVQDSNDSKEVGTEDSMILKSNLDALLQTVDVMVGNMTTPEVKETYEASDKTNVPDEGMPREELGDDVRAKKADIERRRQEELDERAKDIPVFYEEYTDVNGNELQAVTTKDGKQIFYFKSGGNPIGDKQTVIDAGLIEENAVPNKTYTAKERGKGKLEYKINAKYDAELAALESVVEEAVEEPTGESFEEFVKDTSKSTGDIGLPTREELSQPNFNPKNLNINYSSNAWYSVMREYAVEYNELEQKWYLKKDTNGQPIKMRLDIDPTLKVDFEAIDTGLIDPNDQVFYTINPSSKFTKGDYNDPNRVQIVINVRKADGTTYVVGVLSDVSEKAMSPNKKHGFDLNNPITKQSVDNQRAFRVDVWKYLQDSGLVSQNGITSTNVVTLPSQFNSSVKEVLPGKLNEVPGEYPMTIFGDKLGSEVFIGHVYGDSGDRVLVNGQEGLDVRAQNVKHGNLYAIVKHPVKDIYVPIRIERTPLSKKSNEEMQPIITNLANEILDSYERSGNLGDSLAILNEFLSVKSENHYVKFELAKTTNQYHNSGDIILSFWEKITSKSTPKKKAQLSDKELSTINNGGSISVPVSRIVQSNDSPYLINLTQLRDSGFDYNTTVDAPSIQFIKSNMDLYIDFNRLNTSKAFTPFNREETVNYNDYVAGITQATGVDLNKPFILTNIQVDQYKNVEASEQPILKEEAVTPKENQAEVKEDIKEEPTKLADKPETVAEQPTVNTAEDAPINLGDINLDDIGGDYDGTIIDDSTPKTKQADETSVIWNTEKEINWFSTRFPNIPVSVLEDAKEIISKGGSNSWAVYRNAAVYIYENAGTGTLYHEAFHVVFDLMLDKATSKSLYEEAKAKYSIKESDIQDIKDRYKKEFKIELFDQRAEEILLEENMADDFQDYMLTQDEAGIGIKILNFFKRLLNNIQSFFTNKISLNDVFYDINNNKYNTSKLSESELSKFADGLPKNKVSTWSTRKTNIVVSNINNRLFNHILPIIRKQRADEFDGVSDEDMLVSLIRDMGTERLYLEYIYKDIVRTLQSQKADNFAGLDIANKIFNFNTKKFGELIPELEKGLSYYGIIIKDNSSNKSQETTSEVTDEGLEIGREEAWMRDVSLRSTKEGVAFEVKKYLRGLIEIDESGINIKDETGLFDTVYVNYDIACDTLMKDLSDSVDINDMIETINDLSAHHPYYSQIYDTIVNDENLKNAFWNTFSQPARRKLYISNAELKGSNRFFINESNRKNIANVIVESWYNGIIDKGNILQESTDIEGNTSSIVNKELAAEVYKKFRNFKSIKENKGISDLLASIGMNIPQVVFDDQTPRGYNILMQHIEALLSTFKGGFNPFDKTSIKYNSRSLKTIAKAVKKSVVVDREQSYTNVNGDKVYSHIPPNYNITFFNKLKQDPATTLNYYVDPKQGDALYIYGATWMHDILGGSTKVDEINYYELDGLTLKDTPTGQRYEDLTTKTLQIATLNLFANAGNKAKAYYRGPVPADSSTVAVIENKKLSNKEAISELVKVSRGEYKRIKNIEKRLANKDTVRVKNYDTEVNGNLKGGFKFVTIFNTLDSNPVDFHFNNLDKAKDSTEYKESLKWVKEQISNYVESGLASYKEELRESGVLTKNEQGRDVLNVDAQAINGAKGIDPFLSNFYHNHILAQSQIILMTVGDPAFYKPNSKGDSNVSIDFQKRSKETVSPKKNPNIDAIWVDKNGKEHFVNAKTNGNYNYIILKDKEIKSSANELIYEALRQDLPEAEAKHRAAAYGYKTEGNPVNVTDAQTFITLDFYKDTMIAHNRWNQQLEDAYAVLKEGKGTSNDIRVILQPFKPFMFGHNKQFDKNTSNVIVPTQHKNSEFLLLPQFVEKASDELKDVFKFMEENNIQSVSFDSVVKVGATNIQTVGDQLDSNKINTANFKDRGIQQDVPAHHLDDNNIFGTQIRKLILANLQKDVDYTVNEFDSLVPVTKTGQELFDLYHEIVTANIQESFKEIDSRFKDIHKLRDFLLEQAEARGKADELRKALEIVNINGKDRFKLPLFFPTFGRQVESLIISIYKNNVVKQKIKGGAFVQLSSFGFDNDLKVVFDDNHAVKYMEVKMPWWSSNLPTEYIDDNGNISDQFIKDNPELFDAIGYRIPTEDKYSMVPIKVVGFLPQESGGAIMLPPEITTIAGSDFDIDKLYVMLPEYETSLDSEDVRLINYDLNKPAAEQSRKARNNMLLKLMRGVLTNQASTTSLMSPGGFDKLENYVDDVITKVYGDTASRGDLILPQTMDAFTIDNLVAKKLIGIAANHNAVRSILENSNLELEKDLSYNGKPVSSFNRQTTIDGKENINKNLAYFLAAVVDAAKNPLINKINYNFYTANIISTLLHLGIPLNNALNFANTEFVRKLAEMGLNDQTEAKVYLDNIEISDKTQVLDFADANSLEELNKLPDEVLAKTFKQVKGVADEFRNLVNGIGADRLTTLGPTLADNITVMNNLPSRKNYYTLKNTETVLENNPAFGAFTEFGLIASSKKLGKEMPYLNALYDNSRRYIEEMMVGKHLSTKDVNFINSQLNTYLYTNSSLYSLTDTDKQDLKNNLSKEFAKLKEKYPEEFGKNKLISYLATSEIKHNGSTSKIMIFDNASSYSIEQKADIRDSMKDLFESDKADIREAAKKLVQYSFVISGFTFNNNSLFSMFPIEVFTDYLQESNDMSKFSYGLLDDTSKLEDAALINRFVNQFMRNNYRKFAYKVSEDAKIKNYGSDKLGIVEFELKQDVRTNNKANPTYVYRFENGRDLVYKFTEDKTYRRINSLGMGKDLHEYNFNSDLDTSLWVGNNNADVVESVKSQPKVVKATKPTKQISEDVPQGSGNVLQQETLSPLSGMKKDGRDVIFSKNNVEYRIINGDITNIVSNKSGNKVTFAKATIEKLQRDFNKFTKDNCK